MSFTVYMLKDPAGAPRYVGLTKQTLVDRFRNHMGERSCVSEWIGNILRSGETPTIETLQTLPFRSRAAAQMVEDAWIVRLIDDGANLLNNRVRRHFIDDAVGDEPPENMRAGGAK